MRHSESITKLAAALVKAHAEVQHATKDSTNPHFRNDYASLNAVIDTIKPVFAKHGLAVVQLPGLDNGAATLDSVIVHESGEWMASTAGAPLTKADPQGVGSALTYLRRYSLAALAGIAQEDDDGNAASHRDESHREERKADAPKGAKAESDGDMIACPECGGAMWDNRTSKRNPKQPDLKCKDKDCDGAIWLKSWRDDLLRDVAVAHETGTIDAEERAKADEALASLSPKKMLRVRAWLGEKREGQPA